MRVEKRFKLDSSAPDGCVIQCEEPNICPMCKHAIKPQELFRTDYRDNKHRWQLIFLYLCNNCFSAFIASHEYSGKHFANLRHIAPTRHSQRIFDTIISDISPDFVEIYNQALAAETAGLDQISGVGYRKALEFLIKDYLIKKEPNNTEQIQKMELGKCIANKISNEKLKIVASRSTWLGNDQTHYVRHFREYDIQDMKRFIDAVVYWVSMEQITEDALSMNPRGR